MSSPRTVVLSSLVAAVLLLPIASSAQTWTKIGILGPSGQALHCCYFWNSNFGIAAGPFQGLFYYRNGYWTKTNYNGLGPQAFRYINGVLYAAAYREVWASNDSGITWTRVSIPENFAYDVYVSADGTLHGVGFEGSFARLDQSRCVITTDDVSFPLYSTDGGLIWRGGIVFSSSFSLGGWGVFADTCRNTFFVSDESGGTYYSTDGGAMWYSASPPRGVRADAMEGAHGTLYHSDPRGYYRSVDAGFSWDSIGGPRPNREDFHFCVFGPHGDTLVTFSDNEVWMCAGASANAKPEMPVVFSDSMQPCTATYIPITIVGYARTLTGHLSLISKIRTIDTAFVCPAGGSITLWLPIDSSQDDESLTITMQATDGCNDYKWEKSITIHRRSPPPVLRIAAKLAARRCEQFDISLAIAAADCGIVLLDSVILDRTLGLLTTNFEATDTLSSLKTDTLRFSVFTRTQGQQAVSIRLKGRLVEGGGVFDTVLHMTLNISSVPLPVVKVAHTMAVSNCIASVIPILLKASPCDSVQFWTCDLKIDPSLKYSSNFTFPRTLTAGGFDTLLIAFPPQGLSRSSAITVHVTGMDFQNGQTFDTTLQIIVTFSTFSAELDPELSLISLDSVSRCESRDTFVTFRNNGCDTITVTQNTTTWEPGWSAAPQTFPIRLAPGESFNVRVSYHPNSPGSSTQYLSYLIDGSSNHNVTSQQLRLSAVGVEGSALLSLPDTILFFDTVSECDAHGTRTLSLSNMGCDSLMLTNVRLGGASTFSLLKSPASIAPQGSESFTVTFSADTAAMYTATLHLHAEGAHGENARDTTVFIQAVVTRSPRVAALSLNNIDFGTLSYCEDRDTTITLFNRGCKPLHVSNISCSNPAFKVTNNSPFEIAADGSVTIAVEVSADSLSASDAGSIWVASDADTALLPVRLAMSTVSPQHFALRLSSPSATEVDKNITVNVLRSGMLPSDLHQLGFSLTYNGDLLTYRAVDQNDVAKITTDNTGTEEVISHFIFAPVMNRDIIATLHFHAALARQTSSTLSLHCDSISTERMPSDCYVRLDSITNANVSVEVSCGDSLLQRLLGGLPIEILNVQSDGPDVIYTSSNPFAESVTAQLTMIDMLGRVVMTQNASLLPGNSTHRISTPPCSGTFILNMQGKALRFSKRIMLLEP